MLGAKGLTMPLADGLDPVGLSLEHKAREQQSSAVGDM
jgi:hypothetical protein